MAMTDFEFQGTLHRCLRQMHDAIAEEWLSAGGLNSHEEMQELFKLTDEQLTCRVVEGFGLHLDGHVDRGELAAAFRRLREQLDERFPAGEAP